MHYLPFSPVIFHFHGIKYQEINWNREWFPSIPKYPRNYWNNFTNQQNFVKEIAEKYQVDSMGDWRRISLALIRKHGGQVRIHRLEANELRECLPSTIIPCSLL